MATNHQASPGGPDAAARARLAHFAVRSEITRLLAFHGLTTLVVCAAIARALLVPDAIKFPLKWFGAYVPVLAYVGLTFVLLRRVDRRGCAVPRWLQMSNVVVETLLPAGILFGLWRTGTLAADRAMGSPAVLAYAIVLIMSPMRLAPSACLVSGFLAAASHAALVAWSGAANSGPMGGPAPLMYAYAAWLLIGGFAAAFVAREMRAYVTAVVAETQARGRAEREIAVAADIQRGLLPKTTPNVAGFRLAFWSRPADQTGGDYYDWQLLPGDRVAVTLADVSGHGLGPALMAAFCRAYARASLDGRPGLCEAMRHINALMTADLPPGRFVTLAAAVLTPGSGKVELLSAGHGPILVHRAASRTVERLEADGMPLGVDDRATFDVAGALTLSPGDALILVTDGFFEWRRASARPEDHEQFGIDRLCDAILTAAPDPEAVIAEMRARVESFAAGSPQSDDLSAVIIRFEG